ncbi:hypothetical protein LQL77_24305 [Rhodococcus cerastii]|nr:hypothetical protein [Rhodococcus cerastii]
MSAYVYPREWIRGLTESELESLFERAGQGVEVIGLEMADAETPFAARLPLEGAMEKAKVERWLLEAELIRRGKREGQPTWPDITQAE